MWIPTRLEPASLTSTRKGEAGPGLASRPFSASAGATVLVTGMVVVNYVMRRLRELVPTGKAHLDWRIPPKDACELSVWEAFVTNQKKHHDARHVAPAPKRRRRRQMFSGRIGFEAGRQKSAADGETDGLKRERPGPPAESIAAATGYGVAACRTDRGRPTYLLAGAASLTTSGPAE